MGLKPNSRAARGAKNLWATHFSGHKKALHFWKVHYTLPLPYRGQPKDRTYAQFFFQGPFTFIVTPLIVHFFLSGRSTKSISVIAGGHTHTQKKFFFPCFLESPTGPYHIDFTFIQCSQKVSFRPGTDQEFPQNEKNPKIIHWCKKKKLSHINRKKLFCMFRGGNFFEHFIQEYSKCRFEIRC